MKIIRKYYSLVRAALYEEKKCPVVRRDNQELEFLPVAQEILETPASRFSRLMALLITLVLIVAILISWFGYIDIEVVAAGAAVPAGEVKAVQSLIIGKVESIHVREGDAVAAGQLLIKLDPTESEVDITQVRTDLLETRLNILRLEQLLAFLEQDQKKILPALSLNLASGFSGEFRPLPQQIRDQQKLFDYDLRSYLSADEALAQSILQKQAAIRVCKAGIERLKVLAPLYEEHETTIQTLQRKGHVSKVEWLAAREKQVETSQQLLVEQNHLEEASASLMSVISDQDRHRQQFRQQRMESLAELRLKEKNEELTLTKAKKLNEKCYLYAPESGVIEELIMHTIGGVVEPAQVLMTLVPTDKEMEIEAIVENKDRGFIHHGQSVDIKFDSFPYTYYGSMTGRVRQIATNVVITPDQNQVYPIRVTLDTQTIKVPEGIKNVQAGMSVSVEIKTGKRRLLEYFLSPLLRYRDETLVER